MIRDFRVVCATSQAKNKSQYLFAILNCCYDYDWATQTVGFRVLSFQEKNRLQKCDELPEATIFAINILVSLYNLYMTKSNISANNIGLETNL